MVIFRVEGGPALRTLLLQAGVLGALVGVAIIGVPVLKNMNEEGSPAPYGPATVWSNQSGQVTAAVTTCFEDKRPGASCLLERMALADASPEAVAFYRERGLVLTGFKPFALSDVGKVLNPFTNLGPMWVILNGPSGFLLADDLLVRLDLKSGPDGTYDRLLLARMSARPPSDSSSARALTIWSGDNLFESYEEGRGGGYRFIFQAGLHDTCHACGIGVAVRVAVQFDAKGRFREASLIGFCQGPMVTRQVAGRVVTSHRFAGLNFGAEVSEPYVVVLPGLETCPPTTEVN